MPDLITHTLFVYPLKYRFKENVLFILLGAILPDILGRIPGVLFSSSLVGWYQLGIHTPISMLLFIYAFSFLFPSKGRRDIFIFLLLGVFLHFFLDFFQKIINIGNFWFFPFSLGSFQIPLIWPDDTIFLIPFFFVFNMLFLYSVKIFKK